MRILFVLSAMALSGISLHDCKKNEAADAAPTATKGSGAAAKDGPIVNERSITRYPTEHKIDEDATLPKDVIARQSPPNGQMVGTISGGTTVKKVATVPGGTLVIFVDGASGNRMFGWLDDQSFTAPAVTATVGTGRFVPTTRDASAPPTTPDAGGGGGGDPVPTRDAGGGGATVADAGAKAAVTPAKPTVNGKCDPGWIVFPTGGNICRKTCSTDAECGGALKCAQKGSQKLCGI